MNYEIFKQKNENTNKSSKKYIVIDEIKNKNIFDDMQKIQNSYKNSNDIFIKIFENELQNAKKQLMWFYDNTRKHDNWKFKNNIWKSKYCF